MVVHHPSTRHGIKNERLNIAVRGTLLDTAKHATRVIRRKEFASDRPKCFPESMSKSSEEGIAAGHKSARKPVQKPIVVALGGNALESETSADLHSKLQRTCNTLAAFSDDRLLVTHGNGPQIGFLAEQQKDNDTQQSLDILGAETEGWLGYEIERHLASALPRDSEVVTVLTCMEIDGSDPAMTNPEKPIGRWYDAKTASKLSSQFGWDFICQDKRYRRVVPSPEPVRCLQIRSIERLLSGGSVVICAGGGGIPVCRDEHDTLRGVEAVIDKDKASALMALSVQAKGLILATNVRGVYRQWPPDPNNLQPLHSATGAELNALNLEAGSMAPKVQAAVEFANKSGHPAVIGHLDELPALLDGQAGTRIEPAARSRAASDIRHPPHTSPRFNQGGRP